jgi:non-heme chloroperoxidase
MATQNRVVTEDGTELYLKDWGAGRPVVMLHGWPLSADTFDDLALAVASAGMRAIAYDRRGFGRSTQPWTGYDYNTLASDLAAVIKQTGAEDAVLIGFSMGGGEVARYLSRYPDHSIRGAVLIASIVPYMLKTPDNPDGTDQEVFDKIGNAIKADRASFWATFFKQFYGGGPRTNAVSDEVIAWSCQQAMQAGLRATLGCAEAFSVTDLRPDLPAFRVPTLVIHGTGDKTVPIAASARAAAAGIPGSTLIEYEDGPHGLLASHKQRLEDDVLSFLRRV